MAKRQSSSNNTRGTSLGLGDVPLHVYTHIFSYLSGREKANLLGVSSYALDLAERGEIHVEQSMYMEALRVAIQSNDENEFPMIHRILRHCHTGLHQMFSCRLLASLLEVASPYGIRLLSKTYLRPLSCERFVEVIKSMKYAHTHYLKLYHHSPDFVRRVHGRDD